MKFSPVLNMRLQAEVIGRFDHAGDANALLYTPLAAKLTARYRHAAHLRDFAIGGKRVCDFVHDPLPLSWFRSAPGRDQVVAIKSATMSRIIHVSACKSTTIFAGENSL
jgi:hypothetical protein